MRINLPANTPAAIVRRIRAASSYERLFDAYFPRTASIRLSNPDGVVSFSGKGSESVSAQKFFRCVIDLLSQQS